MARVTLPAGAQVDIHRSRRSMTGFLVAKVDGKYLGEVVEIVSGRGETGYATVKVLLANCVITDLPVESDD